jgi:hypothetical protein
MVWRGAELAFRRNIQIEDFTLRAEKDKKAIGQARQAAKAMLQTSITQIRKTAGCLGFICIGRWYQLGT